MILFPFLPCISAWLKCLICLTGLSREGNSLPEVAKEYRSNRLHNFMASGWNQICQTIMSNLGCFRCNCQGLLRGRKPEFTRVVNVHPQLCLAPEIGQALPCFHAWGIQEFFERIQKSILAAIMNSRGLYSAPITRTMRQQIEGRVLVAAQRSGWETFHVLLFWGGQNVPWV